MVDTEFFIKANNYQNLDQETQHQLKEEVKEYLEENDLEEISDDELIEIYQIGGQDITSSRIQTTIEKYFQNFPNDDFHPVLEGNIGEYLNSTVEPMAIEQKIQTYASYDKTDITDLLSIYRKTDSTTAKTSVIHAFSVFQPDSKEKFMDAMINEAKQTSAETQGAFASLVFKKGDVEDICNLYENCEQIDPMFTNIVEIIESYNDEEAIVQLISSCSKGFPARESDEPIIHLYEECGEEGLLSLLQTNLGTLPLPAGRKIEQISQEASIDFLSEVVKISAREEKHDVVRGIITKNWSKSLSIILEKIEQTDNSVAHENLRRIFMNLNSTNTKAAIERLSDESLTTKQRDALILAVTNSSGVEQSHTLDYLIEILESSTENRQLQNIAICFDRLRFSNETDGQHLVDDLNDLQTAIPDRSDLPTPLPHLRDLITSLYKDNRLSEISQVLASFDRIGSSLSDQVLEIIEKEKREAIQDYRNFSNESTMRRVSTEELLKEGEGLKLDFKGAKVPDKKLMKEIISMLNTEGGTILLGVNDDGIATGLKNTNWDCDEPQTRLQNKLNDHVRPQPIIPTKHLPLNETKILRIDVPNNGDMKPFFFREKGKDHEITWVRMGSSKIPANQRHIVNLTLNGNWF